MTRALNPNKTQAVKQPNILVAGIQMLLILACLGALLRGIQLSIAAGAVAGNEFLAALTALVAVALTLIPGIIKYFNIMPVPAALETVFVVFVYLAMFFGEMLHFYDVFAWWDTMLHFSSGILFALVGYMLFLALNKDPAVRNKMNPVSIVIIALLFSIACGVFWELFEYSGDSLLGMNMQRWQNTIPAKEWAAMQNSTNLSNPGLMDTMKDFLNDTAGALASIPFLWRMVKKNSQYVKPEIPCNALIEEMQAEMPKGVRPVVPAVRRSGMYTFRYHQPPEAAQPDCTRFKRYSN